MADEGHEFADRKVEEWRALVAETYYQAQLDAQEALSEFLAEFSRDDAAMRKKVDAGEVSEDGYRTWRREQMLRGQRYENMLAQVTLTYAEANEYAMAMLDGTLPEIYAENANYAAYQVCSSAGLGISFSLMDANAVQEAMLKGENLLPRPSVNRAKDAAWNRKLVASQLTQGIMLGESIPKMAKRITRVAASNESSAVRTARTYATAAQNAGRVSSYRKAQEMGIDLEQEWLATMDNRTRHSHRQVDGERAPVGGTFSNGCRYPGDPDAPYAETMNCRCTLIAAVEGVDTSDAKRWSRLPAGTTYEEWKEGYAKGEKRESATVGEKVSAVVPMARKSNDASTQRRASVKPVNEHLYNSQKNYVERHGGVILRGGPDIGKHLDEMGADASNIGDIIFLREDASTSEVLEEVFHFEQHKRGDYADADAEEMVVRREIDAQRYLLSVAKRYNIPESETEQTKRSLAEYERLLDSIERRKQ